MRGYMILAALGLALASGRAEAAAPPRRIVSLNVCSDQLVLALADRAQIAALSPFAHDPALSAAAGEARDLRALTRPAEQVLAIRPDLLIGRADGAGGVAGTPQGMRIAGIGLDDSASYADVVAQIRRVARAVGHAGRGEALVRRMDRDLAALPQLSGGKVAAYYQRRGFMTGTGTLVDDLMRRAGLINLAARLGKPGLAQVGLEQMIAARPDFIIIERETMRVRDQGTEMLHHPILRAIPRLTLPQAWTVCGGPAYVEAARSLVAQASVRKRR
ncbi:MAG: ABC transporter substrate-binding protein [Sphingobium sp.]|nr:ABC transporter substrate-binding protein [Sphingobium sp.]